MWGRPRHSLSGRSPRDSSTTSAVFSAGPPAVRPDAARRAFVAGRPTDADLIDNQLVAAYVDLMDVSEILELLSSSASDAIPSQASWRLPPPRVVHDFGACLCGCSDELWAVEAEDPSRPREI